MKQNQKQNLEELSNEVLEFILTPLDQIEVRSRVRVAFSTLNLKYLGQIVLIQDDEILNLPNAGMSSVEDIKLMVEQFSLADFAVINWPDDTVIQNLIADRQLMIGRKFLVKAHGPKTIEDEAAQIFDQILSGRELKIVKYRHGLMGDDNPMTLEEIAKGGQVFDKLVTRERVRQIESNAHGRIKNRKIDPSKFNNLMNRLNEYKVIAKASAEEIIRSENFSNASNPIKLIGALSEIWSIEYDFVEKKLPLFKKPFLVKLPAGSIQKLEQLFKALKKEITANGFGIIRPNKLSQGTSNEYLEIIQQSKELICINHNNKIFVTKRPYMLKGKRNKVITSFSKIFSVSATADMRELYDNAKRLKNYSENIPFEIFRLYIDRVDIFEVTGNVVKCVKPPEISALSEGEKIIQKLSKEVGDTMDTTMIHKALVQSGILPLKARSIVIKTPILKQIKKGMFRKKGLFALIGDGKGPDF